jgi:hypothetical protein
VSPGQRLGLLSALAGACGGCSEAATNYHAVQAEMMNEQNAAERNEVQCNDCGPPVYGPDGKIIPQG